MGLVQPGNLREKILLPGDAGAGKTSDWLSIAWWAKQSDDTRTTFYVLDTDDEAVLQVMNEDKYEGMLRSVNGEEVDPTGNIVLHSAYEWPEYQAFSNKTTWDDSVASKAVAGDWIVLDFVTHAWTAAQEGFLHDAANKTRGEVLYAAGVKGASGWDMFKEEFNWNAINGAYFDFIKPILLMSRAHVFMTAEMEVIQEGSKITPDNKEHLAQFGKYKAVGQKKLAYQCRSYLRKQRLARGRVLFTNGKDRARQELDGETVSPDFFTTYLKNVAKWEVA